MGQLRRPFTDSSQEHQPEQSGHQLLGWWAERAGVLADELPERSCQAAHHDGPAWRRAGRWRETVPEVAGCGCDGVSRVWMEGILERILAVLFEGFPGECDGVGGF